MDEYFWYYNVCLDFNKPPVDLQRDLTSASPAAIGMELIMEQNNPVQSAQRIFSILELLSEHESMALSDVVAATGLHKATAHRLLASLISMGYVRKQQINGRYELTLKIVKLASRVLGNNDIIALCRPYLEALSEYSKETVHLVRSEGNEIVYIDKVECTENSIRMVSQVGARRPMYCTGVGKAILALMEDGEVEEIFSGSEIVKFTDKTIVSLLALKQKLLEVRQNGYALDEEENELGVRCIAAAIGRLSGEYYAFSISGPISRMTYGKIGEISQVVIKTKESLKVLCGVGQSGK